MERVAWITLLNDFYGQLLTERQRKFVELYYESDLSLGEIATANGISRPAVHDTLKRAEAALETYESRLGLVRRYLADRQKIRELATLIDHLEVDCSLPRLTEIKKILQELQ